MLNRLALAGVLLWGGACALDAIPDPPVVTRPPVSSDGGVVLPSDAGPLPCGGHCGSGYRCDALLGQCLDLDECDAGVVECGAGACANTPGSWQCVCQPNAWANRRGVCVVPTWRRLPDGPSPRRYPAMTLDRARGKVVLYGGEALGAQGRSDTWEWDGARWREFDAGGPGLRTNAVMAYDDARSQVVLFGGAGRDHVDETWTWNGEQWSLLADAGPGQRLLHSMSYDPRRRQVLLFGGDPTKPQASPAETWAWNGTQWAKLAIAPGTPLQADTQMITNRRTGEVLLYTGLAVAVNGGILVSSQLIADDLRRLEANTWNLIPNAQPGPATPGSSVAAAWSDDGFLVLLDAWVDHPSTWVWDGTWHALDSVGPPKRLEAGAATSPDGGVIICGGAAPYVDPTQPGGVLGDCWWFGL